MERAHGQDKTRQDKTRQDKTRQDKTRQDKTRQGQDKTRQDKTRQDKTRQDREEAPGAPTSVAKDASFLDGLLVTPDVPEPSAEDIARGAELGLDEISSKRSVGRSAHAHERQSVDIAEEDTLTEAETPDSGPLNAFLRRKASEYFAREVVQCLREGEQFTVRSFRRHAAAATPRGGLVHAMHTDNTDADWHNSRNAAHMAHKAGTLFSSDVLLEEPLVEGGSQDLWDDEMEVDDAVDESRVITLLDAADEEAEQAERSLERTSDVPPERKQYNTQHTKIQTTSSKNTKNPDDQWAKAHADQPEIRLTGWPELIVFPVLSWWDQGIVLLNSRF